MPQLTLSMIVRNEEKYLKDCLDSVKDVVDEIVLVDTGSTDSTIEIAKHFGAKVYNFNWINDFSAARNFALKNSTGDWILYLDADERLDSRSISELKHLISTKQRVGYYCTVLSFDRDSGRDHSIRNVRLFANSCGGSFTGKVHEQIEQSLIQNGCTLIQSKILIHHIGYNITEEEKQDKAKRNLFLTLELYETNKSPFLAFQLAQIYNLLHDEENAVKYFKIASESGKLERQYKAQCYSSLALIAYKNRKFIEAEKFVLYSIKIDDRQPFAHLLASKVALKKGEIFISEEKCKRAFILNQYIMYNGQDCALAIVLNQEELIYYGLTIALQNKNYQNVQYYKKELSAYYTKKNNSNDLLKMNLVEKLFNNSNIQPDETETLIKMVNKNNLNFFVVLLTNHPAKIKMMFLIEQLIKIFPDSTELLKLFAKILDSIGQVEEATKVLEKITISNENDPAVFFYLITFYLKQGLEDKIKPIILRLERNFSNIPEVMTQVRTLKRKLLMHTSVPL